MPTCIKCGREYPLWSSKEVLQRICNDCIDAMAAEQLRDSFPCSIPDQAITNYERFAVGVTGAVAFRGLLRKARVKLSDGELRITAETDAVAGANVVTVAKIPVKEISEVRRVALPLDSQMTGSLGRAIIVGVGFAITMMIIITMKGAGERAPIAALLGFGLGFGFSFVPNLFRLRADLSELQLVIGEKKVVPVAVSAEQWPDAEKVLAQADLKVAFQGAVAKQELTKSRSVHEHHGLTDAQKMFIEDLRARFSNYSTEKLKKMKRNGRDSWSEEALAAVDVILKERGSL